MVIDMSNLNELKAIREALGHSQKKMGELLGVDAESAQSAWQRWESDPGKPSARKALEKAKELFQTEKGVPWTGRRDAVAPISTIALKLQQQGTPVDMITLREAQAAYVTPVLPEHIAAAWSIVHEAAMAGGADIMRLDVPAVGEILGAAAEAVAAGRGEEARQRAVRRAEVVLKALGRQAL